MKRKHKIEAFPAYRWICDSCGRENFQCCEIPSAEDKAEYEETIREDFDMEPEDDWPEDVSTPDELRVIPAQSKCDHCGDVHNIRIPDHVTQAAKGCICWTRGGSIIAGLTDEDDLFVVLCVAEDCWRAEYGIGTRQLIGKDFDTSDEAMTACEDWLETQSDGC